MKRRSSILVVHDAPDTRKGWKSALESANFQVLEADSRVDALTLLGTAASGIDLLLTGVMCDGTGLQLAAEAFESRADLPIIVVAGAAWPVGIQNHVAILLEPVSDAELIGTIRTLLSQ